MKQTFWALSNITSGQDLSKSIFDEFIRLMPTNLIDGQQNHQTSFDRMVQNSFLVLEIIDVKDSQVFIESVFAVCNFLTECSVDQLLEIRNKVVIDLMVYVIERREFILKAKNGPMLLSSVLETLERLFEMNKTVE